MDGQTEKGGTVIRDATPPQPRFGIGGLMSGRFQLLIDNKLEDLGRLSGWLEELGIENGWPADRFFGFRTAIYEAVTNVVFYAFDDGTSHKILVEIAEGEDKCLTVHIEDDGMAFDPTTAPLSPVAASLADAAISGRGILLVRALSDDLSYERVRGRNRLTLKCRFD